MAAVTIYGGPMLSLLLLVLIASSNAATWTQCNHESDETHIPRGTHDPHIRYLHLDDCNITNLTEEDFDGLPNLTTLRFSNNNIQQLDATVFRSVNRITILYLQENHLSKIPSFGAQSVLPNLTQLFLTGNDITKLDDPITFSSTTQLHYLALYNNKIEYIHPEFFTSLTKLEVLLLDSNKLSYIDDKIFAKTLSILTISISDNLIQSVAAGAFRNLSLLELNLHGNKLTKLPEGFFSVDGAQLRWFCYHQNPWNCSYLEKIVAREKEGRFKCLYYGDKTECSPLSNENK